MLDKIMDGLKGQVLNSLTEKTGIDLGTAEQVIPMAKENVSSGIMGAISGGQIGDLLNMFSGGGNNLMQNLIFKGILNKFKGDIMTKLGLGAPKAESIGSVALPMILNKIGSLASNDQGEVNEAGLLDALGMDKGGLANMLKGKAGDLLSGGGDSVDKAKDLLGGIGKMFGK